MDDLTPKELDALLCATSNFQHERAFRMAERWLRAKALIVRLENEAHDGGITDGTMCDVHRMATDA